MTYGSSRGLTPAGSEGARHRDVGDDVATRAVRVDGARVAPEYMQGQGVVAGVTDRMFDCGEQALP